MWTFGIGEIMYIETNVLETIEKRLLIWFRHMKKMIDNRFITWCWNADGRGRRQKPRKWWMDGVKGALLIENSQKKMQRMEYHGKEEYPFVDG